MEINELLELFSFLKSDLLWLYFIIVIAVFYGIISLLTWSIKKPLLFLGIPSILVGILLIIVRFATSLFVPNENLLTIFSAAIKPLLTTGVICIVMGTLMIVVYKVLNKITKEKQVI